MATEMQPTPVASPTRQRVAAWIALALASIVPLTVAVNAIATLARIPGAGSDIVISSLYERTGLSTPAYRHGGEGPVAVNGTGNKSTAHLLSARPM
jgi:hypothetical protein